MVLRKMAAHCREYSERPNIKPAGCDELAIHMDDLEEALRLLSDDGPPITAREYRHRVDALLAKYKRNGQ